jgi:hypothetical protein
MKETPSPPTGRVHRPKTGSAKPGDRVKAGHQPLVRAGEDRHIVVNHTKQLPELRAKTAPPIGCDHRVRWAKKWWIPLQMASLSSTTQGQTGLYVEMRTCWPRSTWSESWPGASTSMADQDPDLDPDLDLGRRHAVALDGIASACGPVEFSPVAARCGQAVRRHAQRLPSGSQDARTPLICGVS